DPAPITVAIKGNSVNGSSNGQSGIGIFVETCATCTAHIANNSVAGTSRGIETDTGTGSVLSNRVSNSGEGMDLHGSFSVLSNRIYNSTIDGMHIGGSVRVEHNTIVSTPIGINFFCVVNNTVNSNLIEDADQGIYRVPSSVGSTNTY